MSYASGKYAYGICDRCGFRYHLSELQKEWNNLKTCPECFESKSPQLDPLPHTADPQALYDPRPDTVTDTAALGVITTNTISEFDVVFSSDSSVVDIIFAIQIFFCLVLSKAISN